MVFRLEVFKAMMIQTLVWLMTSYSLADDYQHTEETYSFNLQDKRCSGSILHNIPSHLPVFTVS